MTYFYHRCSCSVHGGAAPIRDPKVKRPWHTIPPAEAVNIILPRDDIEGPLNEDGEPCPWPWDPQQLVGAPMGMHHCRHCGAMCVAGMPHPDYRHDLNPEPCAKYPECSHTCTWPECTP